MYKTSEWVSLGHPDKMADFISCYILDRYLEQDPMTRYALEVMIKDNIVTLGGEITSKAQYSAEDIAAFVRVAVNQIGYTRAYQLFWGEENAISGNNVLVAEHISQQSPDIAQGVNKSGWGDQGIFWGMATNTPETDYMPKDWWLARKIGKHLYDTRYAGIDIKTQVTLKDDRIDEIVVAVPMNHRHFDTDIAAAVAFCCNGSREYKLHVNGTGRYVKHGPIGDCGITGRKLAVDFYGGNCRIGGGSPWTKDGTKADLSLNLLARPPRFRVALFLNNTGYVSKTAHNVAKTRFELAETNRSPPVRNGEFWRKQAPETPRRTRRKALRGDYPAGSFFAQPSN